MTPERIRRIRRGVAYTGFGIVAFAVALVIAFPYERAKERIAARLAERNLDVEIESAGPTLGFGITLKEITGRIRPSTPGAKPTRFAVDWARIRMSPLAALLGGSNVDVAVAALGGRFDVSRESTSKGEVHLVGGARDIQMSEVPGVKEAINLPLGGTINVSLDLAMPKNRYSEANGFLEWKCSGCTIGDGKEKLKVAGNPLLAEGISLPALRLGDLGGRIAVEKGMAKLQGVETKSPDGEIFVEGEIQLRDPLPLSSLNIYVRFKLSDAMVKGSDKIQLLLQLAESAGKRPDGFFGFKMSGSFQSLGKIEWSKASQFIGAGASPGSTASASAKPSLVRPGGGSSRPSIQPVDGPVGPTLVYDEPTRPIEAPGPVPTVAPPPPPPPSPPPSPSPTVSPEESGSRRVMPMFPRLPLGDQRPNLHGEPAPPAPPASPAEPAPAPAPAPPSPTEEAPEAM